MFSQLVPWQRVKLISSVVYDGYVLFYRRLQVDVSIILVLSFFAMLHRQIRAVVRTIFAYFFSKSVSR